MNQYGVLGLLCVLGAMFLGTAILLQTRLSGQVKLLVIVGLWIRVIGSSAYLYITQSYYQGVADYTGYFSRGLAYAEVIRRGDLDLILAPWVDQRWWGTNFTIHTSGAVLSVIGPSLLGAFLVFAMVGYVGILATVVAFQRAFPGANWTRYLMWVVLFPSLWFWPAALGKDAIVLCGVGLTTLGFVGRRSHVNWPLMVFGLLLVFCIRPQVAAVLALAVVAGQWLGATRRWNLTSVLQGVVLLCAGASIVALSGGALGIELFNPDEVQGYMDGRATDSAIGGSALGSGVPGWLAPVNTLLRPFPWEAQGITALLAAVEVVLLWGMVWFRRREVMAFMRDYRRTPLFWMGVVFVGAYATALGMSVSNMGIIARQRVHILPFIFMLVTGVLARSRSTSLVAATHKAPSTARMRRVGLHGARETMVASLEDAQSPDGNRG